MTKKRKQNITIVFLLTLIIGLIVAFYTIEPSYYECEVEIELETGINATAIVSGEYFIPVEPFVRNNKLIVSRNEENSLPGVRRIISVEYCAGWDK
jgi:hypothetical protein